MTLPDGTVLDMFGSGGGQVLAERLSEALSYPVPLLGSVPLDVNLRTGGDDGMPVVWGYPDSATAEEIQSIASQLLQSGESRAGQNLPLFV